MPSIHSASSCYELGPILMKTCRNRRSALQMCRAFTFCPVQSIHIWFAHATDASCDPCSESYRGVIPLHHEGVDPNVGPGKWGDCDPEDLLPSMGFSGVDPRGWNSQPGDRSAAPNGGVNALDGDCKQQRTSKSNNKSSHSLSRSQKRQYRIHVIT